jgi:hypothetical protein
MRRKMRLSLRRFAATLSEGVSSAAIPRARAPFAALVWNQRFARAAGLRSKLEKDPDAFLTRFPLWIDAPSVLVGWCIALSDNRVNRPLTRRKSRPWRVHRQQAQGPA